MRSMSFPRRDLLGRANPNLCSSLLAFWRFGGSNQGAALRREQCGVRGALLDCGRPLFGGDHEGSAAFFGAIVALAAAFLATARALAARGCGGFSLTAAARFEALAATA